MRRWIVVLFSFILSIYSSLPAMADDVLDELDRARSAYEKHDFTAALDAADTALKLIRQAQAEAWKAALPEPLPGWTADPAQSNFVALALLGGGTITSRTYRKSSGTVEISIVTGPPLILQGIGPFLASGLIFGDESKVVIIDGRKVTYSKGDNAYSMMIADKVLIQVKGSGGVDDHTLRGYVRGIKISDVAKVAR